MTITGKTPLLSPPPVQTPITQTLSSIMIYSASLAKLLRRAGIGKYLDLVIDVQASDGSFSIPLSRGLTEGLVGAVGGGFKSDLCAILVEKNLFPGVVCDVGLNMGQTLLEILGKGLPVIRYYGFEPNPSAMAIAERLVRLNSRLASVQLLPWACSSNDAPLRSFSISELDSGATLNPSVRPDCMR